MVLAQPGGSLGVRYYIGVGNVFLRHQCAADNATVSATRHVRGTYCNVQELRAEYLCGHVESLEVSVRV